MKTCVVHQHRATRDLLAKALNLKLGSEVVGFSCLENLLSSSMDYDVFVVYNMFGRVKMDRWEGVKWIRAQRPNALIISMIHRRFFDRRNSPPGADAVFMCAGDEIDAIVKLAKENHQGKSYMLVTQQMGSFSQ
jgi:hypothetical protein